MQYPVSLNLPVLLAGVLAFRVSEAPQVIRRLARSRACQVISLKQPLNNQFLSSNNGVSILVKVKFQPLEELIIHESINHSLPDLIKLCSVGLQPGGLGGPLNWAEGVVFRFSRALATDEVFRELLKGKVHWIVLEWALMPQYEQVIPIEEINAKIPVINVSTTTILCDVAKALKEQAQQETKSASRFSWEGGARAGAVNHMQPEGTFCQSCGMPLHKPEDHGTEANGSQSKNYCSYCYQTGEFREPEMTLDEMIEISAKGWSDQDPDVSLEQAQTKMKQILPHLERWRAREIQF